MHKNKHTFFLRLAKLISTQSKDKHTQVGCVIIDKYNVIVSTGYNGFPRGINDDIDERYERPEKYFWFEHGERNAIYNAARNGIKLKDCIIYVQAMPCMACSRAIVQAGIKQIIIDKNEEYKFMNKSLSNRNNWQLEMQKSKQLFKEAKVKVLYYDSQK